MTHPFQTASDVRKDRELREARAADRASQLEPGDYYASDNFVMVRPPVGSALGTVAVTCETHWDACLVLLALGKANDETQA